MALSETYIKAFEQAAKLHAKGQVRKAQKILEGLLNRQEDNERALNVLVKIHLQLGENNKAIKHLKTLCKTSPESLLYCDTLAKLYTESGQLPQTRACYKTFLKHNPSVADAYYSLAQTQTSMQLFQDAIDSYEQALQLNISAPEEVHTNLSLIYNEFSMNDEAVRQLELALEENASYVPALFNLGSRHEEKGAMDLAEIQFNKVLEQQPDHALALARLAGLKRYESKDSEILKRLRGASDAELTPLSKVDVHYGLGKVLDDSQQFELAFSAYQQANLTQQSLNPQYDPMKQEQSVSSMMSFFDAQWFAKLKPVSDAKLLFICGMFRSGSTLLEQILASHSTVTAGGECDYFPRLVNGGLSPFPISLKKTKPKQLDKFAAGYLEYLSSRFPEAQIITDKRPDNFVYAGVIKTLFPNAVFIHSSRHAIDNCLSVYFTQLNSQMSYATDLTHVAHYFKQQQRLMEHWKQLFPASFCEVNYEALLADPELQTKKLLQFCELEWQDNCLDFHLNDNRVQTASAWQVRQPLYTRSSGRWKNYEKHIEPLLNAFPEEASRKA